MDGRAALRPDEPRGVFVWYATDREPLDPMPGFSDARAGDRTSLSYGSAFVTLPPSHRIGVIERREWWRVWRDAEDPERYVVVRFLDPLDRNVFLADIADHLSGSSSRDVLVFVPGYNVSFEAGLMRTAQIAADLQFAGAPVLYSWPSEEVALRYLVAEENAAWTVPHLVEFLECVAADSGADHIHILAHSMGNRAVAGALERMALKHDERLPVFQHVVLTAPDIDAAILRQISQAIAKTARLVTLYASAEDVALGASAHLHDHPRAGQSVVDMVVVPGFETIDATGVDSSFLKHSYFSDTDVLLNDIFALLRHDQRAAERFGLVLSSSTWGSYWRFAAR